MGRVIDLIHRLGKHDCLVGRSGDNWVGVYSGEGEDTAGRSTPKFALDISNNLEDDVLGLGLYEEEFKYWLFNRGKLIDQFPPGGIASFFIKYRKHPLLLLSNNPDYRQKMVLALVPKKRRKPHEILGMTEERFIAESGRELAQVHLMSPEERKQMEDKYARLRSPHEHDFQLLCEAIGISEADWNYSDLIDVEETDDGKALWMRMDLTMVN